MDPTVCPTTTTTTPNTYYDATTPNTYYDATMAFAAFRLCDSYN